MLTIERTGWGYRIHCLEWDGSTLWTVFAQTPEGINLVMTHYWSGEHPKEGHFGCPLCDYMREKADEQNLST